MTDAAVKTRAQAVQDDALAARLAALSLPEGGFTAAARADALVRLTAMGLPGRRDEYWRYTDPRAFNAPVPAPIAIEKNAPDSPLFEDLDRLRIVFVDGVFDAAASDDPVLAGVEKG